MGTSTYLHCHNFLLLCLKCATLRAKNDYRFSILKFDFSGAPTTAAASPATQTTSNMLSVSRHTAKIKQSSQSSSSLSPFFCNSIIGWTCVPSGTQVQGSSVVKCLFNPARTSIPTNSKVPKIEEPELLRSGELLMREFEE
ncbi:hypothetical protein MTR_4g018950 [Medicago truncatula]|uniref:Transmembrane protein n=1 Tax=Medicago truncatula TaxID=3880 RepID=G7JR88_MEDTR|nr:hypothetical protein MTR_4g018950 [Medicago truncatula]